MIKEKPIIKTCIECGGEVEILQLKAYTNKITITKAITGTGRVFLGGAYYQCKECNFKEYL